tara:strand:+ start:231 stop:713 length:483 start_codon:yes stop_codon:yes gene_type:complete
LQSVFLGNDEDDDPVTSAVVEATEPVKKPTHLKGQSLIAKQALFDALAAHGQTKAGEGISNDRKLVSVDKWREHCDLRGLSRGDSDSVALTAFLRAQKALQEKGVGRSLRALLGCPTTLIPHRRWKGFKGCASVASMDQTQPKTKPMKNDSDNNTDKPVF